MNSIAESVMGNKSPAPDSGRAPRSGRRWAERFDARNTKRATRKHRQSAIEGLASQQTALGLARVYLDGAGNEAMRKNVQKHIDSLALALARQNHPELWEDDTVYPEQYAKQIEAAIEEAHGQILVRLREVLDAHA